MYICFLCISWKQILPLITPTKMIMNLHIGHYQWHEFFPHGKCSSYHHFLFATTFDDTFFTNFSFSIATNNIGVVIAIWAPIVLVSRN